MHERMTTLK